mmetsp:Transcript_22136/g.30412  ORF Transcript_22136/g.30412 Transcript_22136/m.30412 type:complete len:87 (+) Transcript_22136:600-860(+)
MVFLLSKKNLKFLCFVFMAQLMKMVLDLSVGGINLSLETKKKKKVDCHLFFSSSRNTQSFFLLFLKKKKETEKVTSELIALFLSVL